MTAELETERSELAQGAEANGSPEPRSTEESSDSPSNEVDLSSLDLSSLPQFQRYQSETDKKWNQRMSQIQQESQEQLKRLESELHETRLRTMDSTERDSYIAQRREQESASTSAELEQLRQEIARRDYLNSVSEEYGVPLVKLNEAQGPADVQEIVIEHMKNNQSEEVTALKKQLDDLAALVRQGSPDNAVDTGSSIPRPPATELDALKDRYESALSRRDPLEMQRVQQEAATKGINYTELRG